MQCPVCSGVAPLLEEPAETPHMITTTFWFEGADLEPLPEGVQRHDFDGVLGTPLSMTFQEKKQGGAILTAHYRLIEGNATLTLKSRVPLNAGDRDALFSFMKDSLRLAETRGRKPSKTIEDVRRAMDTLPQNATAKCIATHLNIKPRITPQL
jgi:hypothetical protein